MTIQRIVPLDHAVYADVPTPLERGRKNAYTPDFNPIRVFSFGGGTQSTAVMVMQAQGKLEVPYDAFLFSNVGDDSENPETLAYLRDYTIPYAEQNNIPLLILHKTTRGIGQETLLQYIHRVRSSVPIPARMSNGAPGNRSCTIDYKIRVVDKWIRQHKFTHAIVGLGISVDEYTRAKDTHWHDREPGNPEKAKHIRFWKQRHYPLLDQMLRRDDCISLVLQAGLPRPPKSACWFCPYTSRGVWMQRKQSNVTVTMPDGEQRQIFEAAVELENTINEKRGEIGRDRVYLHPRTNGHMKPLDEAVPDQLLMFPDEDDNCESGYCMT